MQPNKTTGRLPDGTAVSVSGVGLSPRSAWLQTVIFETDTPGGEMAGGVRGRGRPNHHPLPKWWWAKWYVLRHRHCGRNGEAAKCGGRVPRSQDTEEQQAQHGGSPGAVPFLL